MKLKLTASPGAHSHDETRRQLLEAAGGVFAEAGFRDATVREICRRAGRECRRHQLSFRGQGKALCRGFARFAEPGLAKYPPLLGVAATRRPKKSCARSSNSLLLRIFDKGPTAWHGKLMLREMIEPTKALDSMVEERVRPMAGQLWQIVSRNPGLPD